MNELKSIEELDELGLKLRHPVSNADKI